MRAWTVPSVRPSSPLAAVGTSSPATISSGAQSAPEGAQARGIGRGDRLEARFAVSYVVHVVAQQAYCVASFRAR